MGGSSSSSRHRGSRHAEAALSPQEQELRALVSDAMDGHEDEAAAWGLRSDVIARYLVASKGDLAEAKAALLASIEFRREHSVDRLLDDQEAR